MKQRVSLILLCLFVISCKTAEKRVVVYRPVIKEIKKEKESTIPPLKKSVLNQLLSSEEFENHFTGLVIYDPKKRKDLFNQNGSKFFTPASNIKIFTFFTCLNILDDHIPFFSYADKPEGLYIRANANPSFLHPYLKHTEESFHFLRKFNKPIFMDEGIFEDEPLGDGWAWDDASAYYQCEKTPFPIYGNLMAVIKQNEESKFKIDPPFLNSFLTKTENVHRYPKRASGDNTVYLSDSVDVSQTISIDLPICFKDNLCLQLLSDTLNRSVRFGKTEDDYKDIGKTSLDPLLIRMMKDSDNMMAEQLLLHCSHVIFDTMGTNRIITYSLDSIMGDLQQRPRWVDGSGLSRYNLATPNSIIKVLAKIKRRLHKNEIPIYFAPFEVVHPENPNQVLSIYAKTGSLSNNFNLSGYMTCMSGKEIIFSFMNNHYRSQRKEMLAAIRKVLQQVYLNY